MSSPRFLSVRSTYVDPTLRNYRRELAIEDFITINAQTGQRVYLNDLVDLSDEFVYHIKMHRVVHGERMESDCSEPCFDCLRFLSSQCLWKWLEGMSFEEVRGKIDESTMTIQCVLDANRDMFQTARNPAWSASEAIETKSDFYVLPDKLILIFYQGVWSHRLTIYLDDIAEYLLVDPW